MYPIEYGSEYYKSNGVFMLEPSHFSQILALGVIAELASRRRTTRLAILSLALLTTYSGTGPLLLAIMSPLLAPLVGFRNIAAGALCGKACSNIAFAGYSIPLTA